MLVSILSHSPTVLAGKLVPRKSEDFLLQTPSQLAIIFFTKLGLYTVIIALISHLSITVEMLLW